MSKRAEQAIKLAPTAKKQILAANRRPFCEECASHIGTGEPSGLCGVCEIKADCASVLSLDDSLTARELRTLAPTIAQDALDLLAENERLRARLAECGPGIGRLRDLQQAYASGGDYMRQFLEAIEARLPAKESALS